MVDKITKIIYDNCGDLTIESINKAGSQLISDSPNDLDFRVIVSEDIPTKILYDANTKINVFVFSKQEVEKMCNLNVDVFNRFFVYTLDQEFRKYEDNNLLGDIQYQFKLLENPEKYKELVKQKAIIYTRSASILTEWGVCHKRLWWIILGLMMIDNNSMEITDEMKEIALKCHNLELDRKWNDWVKNKLNIE